MCVDIYQLLFCPQPTRTKMSMNGSLTGFPLSMCVVVRKECRRPGFPREVPQVVTEEKVVHVPTVIQQERITHVPVVRAPAARCREHILEGSA